MADNLKLLKNIFAEMEKPLFLGDGLTSGEFHSLMQPGQFISTNLQESNNSDDMAIQASLLDDLIDTKFIYTPITGSISEQYSLIMTSAALPYKKLSDHDQKEVDDLYQWLMNAESTYTVFQSYYYDALNAYSQESYSQNPAPGKLQQLYQKMTKAMNDWQTFGRKIQYENNQARWIYLLEGNPLTIWNKYRNLLQVAHQKVAPNRGPYTQTFLIPRVSQWNSPGTSWARFEKTINESDSYNYSKTTSWGGGGSAGWGLFSIGGSAGGGSTYTHSNSDVSTVSIAFDYMRVRIDRPWLVRDVFGFRWWWWKAAFGYKLLSDGGNLFIDPPVRPVGIIPFLPQHVIVARNVTITANFTHSDQTTITSAISASASAGWGPFSIKGSYSESTFEQTTHASFDGTSLRIDHPQIIAFTGSLIPLSPNPDRTLPWQGDQAPFDPPAHASEEIAALRQQESDEIARLMQWEGIQEGELAKVRRGLGEMRRRYMDEKAAEDKKDRF